MIPRLARCSLLAVMASLAPWWSATPDAPAYSRPRAPAGEQTHPRVHPRAGNGQTTFAVTLTAGDDLGVHGVVQSGYRIEVTSDRRGCAGTGVGVTSATKGQRLMVRLAPPHGGWCRGPFRGIVLLQRGPYCPTPAPGQPPRPCPLFATQDLDVGRFAFSVA